jgi:hypothetical protein
MWTSLLCGFNIRIIKRLGSLNTTIYFDIIKKEKQLHVSARGHRQVGSFGFARKNAFCNALLIYNDPNHFFSRKTKGSNLTMATCRIM